MAVSVGAKFTIKGDVQGAIRAAADFGKAVTGLNTRLQTLTKNQPQMEAFNKTITSSSVRLTTWTGRALAAAAAAATLTKTLNNLHAAMNQASGAGATPAATAPAATATAPVATAAATAGVQVAQVTANASKLSSALSIVKSVGSAAFTAISLGAKGAGSALGIVQKVLDTIKMGIANITSAVPRAFSLFQFFVMNLSDGLRMISLGLTHIASTLLFFVSLPLAGAIFEIGRAVLDFDDQMKKVQKTTGLTTAQMNKLIPAIRELGKTTATPLVQLGQMAEQIGQLGVTSIKSIAELLDISNMLVIATDVTADEVAIQLGKIANAFHINLNKSTDEIRRLANVLNMLENTTAASAREILDATFKFAPVAGMMNMNAQETMAFGATLASMGYEASEAGTALRNIGIYLVKNIDKVQQSLSAQDKYNTVAKVSAALKENTTGVILDYVRALSQETDLTKKLGIAYDQLNLRGGRGAASMAGNVELLLYNLATANKEYKESNSLMREYDRAMSSTKSQVAVMKNNLTDLGITVGEVVLPVLNKLIQLAIPGIQMLAEAFRRLNPQTQLLAVGILALVTVGGPLMMIITQMLHGLFWMALGFSTLLKLVPGAVVVFGGLLHILLAVLGAFNGIPLVISVATLAIMKVLQKRGIDIAKFFRNLADRALAWGENLAATYASGLISGAVRFIARAIAWIGNLIANFLESKSPPKMGPLANIDKWGAGLMRTFLKSFATADFSILEDVGNTIQNILSNMFSLKKIGEGAQFSMLLDARKWLAELISAFNETGKVASNVLLKITANLGEFKDDVAKLIRYWLEYTRIQKELAAIETRRKELKRVYTDEMKAIALSGKSAEERLAMIRRSTSAYNQENDKLDQQQESLEEQEDQAKDNLTWQQQFIRALTVQEDIQGRLVEAMERMAKAAEGMGDIELPSPGDIDLSLPQETQDAIEALYNLPKRISEAKFALKGFFAGLRGEDVDWGRVDVMPMESQEEFIGLYDTGVRVRDIWLRVKGVLDGIRGERISDEEFANMTPEQQQRYNDTYGTFEDIRSIIDDLKTGFAGLGTSISGVFTTGQKSISDFIANLVEGFSGTSLGRFVAGFMAMIKGGVEPLKTAWGSLLGAIGPFVQAFMRLIGLITQTPAFQWLTTQAGNLANILGTLAGIIWGMIVRALMALGAQFIRVSAFVLGFWTLVMNFVSDLLSGKSLSEAFANFMTGLTTLETDLMNWFSDLYGDNIEVITKAATDIIQGLIDGLLSMGTSIQTGIRELSQKLVDAIMDFFGIRSPSTLTKGYARDMVQGMIDGWVEWWDKLLDKVDEKIQAFKDKLNGYIASFKQIGWNIANGLREGFIGLLDKLLGTNAPEAFKSFIRSIRSLFELGSPSRLFKRFGLGVGRGFQIGLDQANRGLAGVRNAVRVDLPTSSSSFGASIMAPALAPALATSFGVGGSAYELHLHLHNPVVREEQDIKKIARAVKKELDGDTTFANRFHGSTMT